MHRPSKIWFGLFFLFLVSFPVLYGQSAKVLKTNGKVAVISAGRNMGLNVGSYMTIYRHVQSKWKPLTYVRVTRTKDKYSLIQLVPAAPQIKMLAGDRLVPVRSTASPQKSFSLANPSEVSTTRSNSGRRIKGVYLGPSIGVFTPFGDMEEIFETTYSYGGILGIQFRPDLDVSARFLFTLHEDEWSLWNIQLLGRRYSEDGFLIDFGYGVLYPQIWEGGYISLGFCGGLGYTFSVAYDTWMEFGLLYSYYPHFIGDSAQFLNIELRLIL